MQEQCFIFSAMACTHEAKDGSYQEPSVIYCPHYAFMISKIIRYNPSGLQIIFNSECF